MGQTADRLRPTEHFATGYKPETGVIVMNMHKTISANLTPIVEDWLPLESARCNSSRDQAPSEGPHRLLG